MDLPFIIEKRCFIIQGNRQVILTDEEQKIVADIEITLELTEKRVERQIKTTTRKTSKALIHKHIGKNRHRHPIRQRA